MTLISIGDQVTEGKFAFHSRFNRAANFRHNGHLICVVDEQIGAGPPNVVIRNLNSGPMTGRGAPLEVSSSVVVFEGRRFCFTDRHRYDSSVDFQLHNSGHFHHNLSFFEELLRTTSPPTGLAFLLDEKRIEHFRPGFERSFAEKVKCNVHAIFNGHLLDGIRSLRGCGLGLTPSGDDFIAGLLIGLNLHQKTRGEDFQSVATAVFNAAKAGNVFSNTFLGLARRGLLFERAKGLILSLMQGDSEAVRRATEKLLAIGESSGADFGTGFLVTMRVESGVLRRWSADVRNPWPVSVL